MFIKRASILIVLVHILVVPTLIVLVKKKKKKKKLRLANGSFFHTVYLYGNIRLVGEYCVVIEQYGAI